METRDSFIENRIFRNIGKINIITGPGPRDVQRRVLPEGPRLVYFPRQVGLSVDGPDNFLVGAVPKCTSWAK
jgi:hypothetical protein